MAACRTKQLNLMRKTGSLFPPRLAEQPDILSGPYRGACDEDGS